MRIIINSLLICISVVFVIYCFEESPQKEVVVEPESYSVWAKETFSCERILGADDCLISSY